MSLQLPIVQHQNGFLKVALPLGGRLHVWSPWNPPTPGDAEVHDHPFEFSSLVLAGEMINTRLRDVDDVGGEYVEHRAECVTSFGPQPALLSTPRRVRLDEDGCDIVRRGELYRMAPWLLHRTDAVFALTLFRKGRQAEGHSRVFVSGSVPEYVPAHANLLQLSLARALSAARLTLEDVVDIERTQAQTQGDLAVSALTRATAIGYHLRDIPRSPHGTVGKIVEEALELAEAAEQGVRIMTLCECADIVSALRGYLHREHPGTSFEDVVQMATITERVFASGRRKEAV